MCAHDRMARLRGRLTLGLYFAVLVLVITPTVAWAQPYPLPDTWGGDIFSRPRLTGDWGGEAG
jgi:hypothetical protein